MKIEKNSVELVKEPDILKRIELAGRCCYNSQHLIKENSYEKFITKVVSSGHCSVIEHSNIIIKYCVTQDLDDLTYTYEWILARKGLTNSHIWVTIEKENSGNSFIMISGNARAWQDFLNPNIKSDYLIDSEDIVAGFYKEFKNKYPILFVEEVSEPWKDIDITFLTEEEAVKINIIHTFYTFKIVTSRDITHQIVRHRVLSFSQQSQRWCNYTLDKNDGEVTFIEPRLEENSDDYEDWVAECESINSLYSKFIESKYKPEVARCILPNCTKTIIYVSGHYEDWQNFIELRSGSTAQEEIRDIALKIDKEIKKCYID